MKRKIAMRCTQEEFDSIKDRLPQERIFNIDPFDEVPYLVNNFNYAGQISNIYNSKLYDEIHETFNADIFLEACGEEVEKFWKGSEMQIMSYNGKWVDCSKQTTYRLKPQSNYSQEIEALQQKAKENGMKAVITFEKL
jgi:hypothetical protein